MTASLAVDRTATNAAGAEADLMLQRVRFLARMRVEWLRASQRDTAAGSSRLSGLHADVDAVLADRDRPELEHAWRNSDATAQPIAAELTRVDAALAQQQDGRLAQLRQIFGLTQAELDLLQLCLATAIDPDLTRVWAFLHPHPGRTELTEPIAARLLGHGRTPQWTDDSALYRWDLVHRIAAGAGEPDAIACDPVVRDWFLDRDAIDPLLAGIAREVPAHPAVPGWPLEAAAGFIDRTVHQAAGRARCTVVGPPRSGRRTFVAAVAASLGLPVLNVHADGLDAPAWRTVFVRAQRYAYLYRCVLVWSGDAVWMHAWPAGIPLFPIQFAIGDGAAPLRPVPGVVDRTFDLPMPSIAVREALWSSLVPHARDWPRAALHDLAARYRAWPGDIAKVREEGAATPDDAALRLRECARGRLGDVAELLECPFVPGDLVLPHSSRDALDDLLFEARARAEFWEQPESRRLFPQGRGLLALFSGPPGTGKTMAAQVIAAALGMDLYRINYAALVSKWVGESAKNTQALLRQAASMDCILLFDEADAMFARRTSEMKDAQDKYANTDASHLMVAIEAYGGIVILASNLKGHIDPAFIRRLRYIVEFPKPDAVQRLELWTRLVAALAGRETCDRLQPELRQLAANVEATGSQIKFALVGGLLAAQRDQMPLTLEHLLRGLNRELTKEGRGLSDRERERIAADVR